MIIPFFIVSRVGRVRIKQQVERSEIRPGGFALIGDMACQLRQPVQRLKGFGPGSAGMMKKLKMAGAEVANLKRSLLVLDSMIDIKTKFGSDR